MSRPGSVYVFTLAMLGGGCSIHPLPQDVTPLNTYWIVAQVRCEVKFALEETVKYAISRRPDDAYLVKEINDKALSWADVPKRIKTPDLKEVLSRYSGATIGYDFSLDMTEDNNITGGVTLTRPIIRGANTIGFNVGTDHKRQNTRTFSIDDTFEGLLLDIDQEYCKLGYNDEPNYNYPITGKTRLRDTVSTFLSLNQSGGLGMKAGSNGPKTPTLTDDLQFTTSYNGSVSPGATFTPLGQVLALTGATGKFDNTRSDIHRVTIAMAMPENANKNKKKLQEESKLRVRDALDNANANRTQIDIQKISNSFSSGAGTSLLSSILR